MSRPDYGIDAPGLVRTFLMVGVGLSLTGLGLIARAPSPWVTGLGAALLIPAVYALFMFALMLRGSLVDKVRDAEAILDLRAWTGDEQVLDVGCGRGLMLVRAASRLTRGRAYGVDIWASQDQSANVAEAPLTNARLAGVGDRVAVQTADARDLPFPDGTFDVVLSHWMVHNLTAPTDRLKALQEMMRVTRPSGAILLTDIVNRDEYRAAFQALGAVDVRLVVLSPMRDRFLSAISFGAFQPATVSARKAA